MQELKLDNLEGHRLGHFTITSKLGEGGMGVVYLARDSRLNRDVAVKVLPAEFAENQERRKRFDSEARLAGGLNHPNIVTVYEIGWHDGQMFMVTELLEGKDLRQEMLVARIGIPAALDYAIQIAKGLTAAHDRGIVHRDIKPGNLFVTNDGLVKILDYGLAKLSPFGGAVGSQDDTTITQSSGTLIGTVGYMAPEQVRGGAVDQRADVWAFGCVLFEMLTGTRAFDGGSGSDKLASILEKEPDWEKLPRGIPHQIRSLLKRCLTKDATRRQRDMGDVVIELEQLADEDLAQGEIDALGQSAHHRAAWWVGIGAAAGLVGGLTIGWVSLVEPPGDQSIQQLEISLPEAAVFDLRSSSLAISPDGSRVLYISRIDDQPLVMIRSLATPLVQPLKGTEGAISAFFSPDGESVGFFTGNGLFRVPITGGEPTTIVRDVFGGRGSWGRDGTIVFRANSQSGLEKVGSDGGEPVAVTSMDLETGQISLDHPAVLPNADVLYEVYGGKRGIWVHLNNERTSRFLVSGGMRPRYLETGHLAFIRDGDLLAVPYDLQSARVTGDEVVLYRNTSHFDVSPTGVLLLAVGRPSDTTRALIRLPFGGDPEYVTHRRREYRRVRLSKRGNELAVVIRDSDDHRDIWLLDLIRDTLTRVTNDGWHNSSPEWFHNSRRFVYLSSREGILDMYELNLDEGFHPRRLTNDTAVEIPCDISSDDEVLLYVRQPSGDPREIRSMALDGSNRSWSLAEIAPGATWAQFDPSGRWIVFDSNDSGSSEVYVRNLDGGPIHQISVNGGGWCNWSDEGSKIFFRADSGLMAVSVSTKPSFEVGQPYTVIKSGDLPSYYDVLDDGESVIAAVTEDDGENQTTDELRVVLNWYEEVRRRVASK